MERIDTLRWGEIPELGSPSLSWPIYGRVGVHLRSGGGTHGSDGGYWPGFKTDTGLKREDDEIILILSAILKEL
jgi:hypothetical protein